MVDMTGIEVMRGQVLPEWIDINEHMNVAYYLLAFDRAVDALWTRFGLTDEYIRTHDSSTIAVESHVTWRREIFRDDPFVVTTQVIAFDEKRIHQFQRMYHAEQGFLSATCEWMNLHFDTRIRRVSPWPDAIREQIAEFVEGQGELSWPEEAGRRMNIGKPVFSARIGQE